MDQLTAYRILGIAEGSSAKEIKEAYAALSKEYHPEEHPEEFQQIHEAYSTLIRMSRGRNRSVERRQPSAETEFTEDAGNQENLFDGYEQSRRGEERLKQQETERAWRTFEESYQEDSYLQDDSAEERERQTEEREAEHRWKKMDERVRYETEHAPDPQEEREEVPEPEWDFDSALHRAERQEQADAHELTLRALSEVKILLTPEYMHKLKRFKAFFTKPEYQEILKKPEFIAEFAVLLQNTHLKKRIYDYFIDYYRLRGMTYSQLIPEAKALYDILEKKRGMQAKNKENAAYIVPAAIIPAIRVGLRNVDFSKEVFLGLGSIVILVIAGIWLYRKLYENHSSIFSQAMIALLVMVLQIVMLFSGVGAVLFGSTETGDVIGVLLFMLAGIWLIVLGIAAVILKMRNNIRKKK